MLKNTQFGPAKNYMRLVASYILPDERSSVEIIWDFYIGI